ncbi:MAG: fimbrillin family protein [Bacteroidaceae bacterium]|nr:fimbrillin family protein [Bacteroidaceae bacterium]
MKNFLKILPLICLCLACSNDMGEGPDGQKAIGFGAKIEKTRAVAGLPDVQANGFSVWGGYSANEHLFDGRKVTYSGGQWGYANPEYWTLNTYNFHAVYPATDAGAYVSASASNGNMQVDVTGFDASSDVDLMHATALNMDGSVAPLVNLSFKHTQTNLSFELNKHVDNAADDIVVTQVYLQGIYARGDYSWRKEGDNVTASWTIDNTQAPIEKGASFDDVSLDVATYKTFLSDILVLPQPVHPEDHPVTLMVVYDYIVSGGPVIEDNVVYAKLPENPVWEPNKKITYRATINAKKDVPLMDLSVVVETTEWDELDIPPIEL